MRDFRAEIDETDDIDRLRAILQDLGQLIETELAESPEGVEAEMLADELEILLDHGEAKLDRLIDGNN
jgi:hypothetical protein